MGMKVHYMNCGTMHPRVAYWLAPHLDRVPCLCLLVEAGDRLVLVDAGFGVEDMRNPRRLGRDNLLLNLRPDESQTALRRLQHMGFDPRDVSDIVCTHLDRDHAGGLADFPHARVHVSATERDVALHPVSRSERERYRRCHFAHGPRWVTYEAAAGGRWFGMDGVAELSGVPGGILLVPLPGHTRGHCGVAVETGEGWLLHCGDAYYVQEELRVAGPAPVGIRGFRLVAHVDHAAAMHQVKKLKGLLGDHGGSVRLLSAHDQFSYRHIFGSPL